MSEVLLYQHLLSVPWSASSGIILIAVLKSQLHSNTNLQDRNKSKSQANIGYQTACSEFMSLFVSGIFFFSMLTEEWFLFLAQWLTSWPPRPRNTRGTMNVDVLFFYEHKHSPSKACRHMGAHFILKQLLMCERRVWCAKHILWCVRTLLNGASLTPPHSEVTLSSQAVLQINWVWANSEVH